MKILLACGNPYLPQLVGGIEINTHQLAGELIARGHEVSVLARQSYRSPYGVASELATRLRRRGYARDDRLGYPVFRARRPWLAAPAVPRPEVVVIQNTNLPRLADAFLRLGIPTFGYLHGLEFEGWDTDALQSLPLSGFFANSEFTAGRFRARHGGTAQVIPPVLRAAAYRTATSRRNVTFINPVAEKGLDLALDIAAGCPEIPFCFVKAWPLAPRTLLRLRRRLARLPNVTLRERTDDMRLVYREARLLLVPSWVAETWGRVASEAQFSGIPVLASDRGGLPEAVGPGGIVLGAEEPAERWIAALRRLWTDAAFYGEKSHAATIHSRRPMLDTDAQISRLVAALQPAGR